MRTLRILFIVLGYFLGQSGIIIRLCILKVNMASLKSVGVPYLAPFIPFNFKEMKGVLFLGDLRKIIKSKHTYPHKD